jgi:hypothetical protein
VLTRHRGSRAPTLLVAAILAAVIVAGCRAEPVDESGLDDIEDSDPVEAEEPEPDPEDDPSEDEGADESEGDASAETLDESDGDGGLIPESAFEINDDLDASEDAQLEVLAVYADGVELVTKLFAGQEVAEEDLAWVFAPDELAQIRGSAQRLEAEGRIQLTEDASSEFVRLVSYAGGQALVHHCQRNGPRSGIYDADTGELLVEPRSEWQLYTGLMGMLVEGEAPARWVTAEGGVIDGDPSCP